jgi:hypothetical protein
MSEANGAHDPQTDRPLRSILDVKMVCDTCLKTFRAGECEPDVDGDGLLGCPEPDCDGLMVELPAE